jgi:DNA polymerase (family 10)
MDNQTIAQLLRAYGDELAGKRANLYRVRAYRRAAAVMQSLDRPAADLVAEKGRAGLAELPGIGTSLAFTIESLVRTGQFRTRRVESDSCCAQAAGPVIMSA